MTALETIETRLATATYLTNQERDSLLCELVHLLDNGEISPAVYGARVREVMSHA